MVRALTIAVILATAQLASVNPKGISFQTDSFTVLKGYERVRILKNEKTGEILGYLYVKKNNKYTTGVLSDLLVIKENGTKVDTLYRIDFHGFFNSRGNMELKNKMKNYYGFKLRKNLKTDIDSFSVSDVDSKGKIYSDDNDFFIAWNYEKKSFEYVPAP